MNFNKIIELAKTKNIDEMKFIGRDVKSSNLKWENGKVETVSSSSLSGLQVFGIKNKNEASIQFSGASEQEVINALDKLEHLIANKTKEADAVYESLEGVEYLKAPKTDFQEIETTKAIKMITSLGEAINASQIEGLMTKNTMVGYGYGLSKSSLVNSKGLNLSKEEGSVFTIFAVVYAAKGEDNTRSIIGKAYKHADEYSEQELIDEIKADIKLKLEKQDFENKEYEVVFAPDMFFQMFEQISHHISARTVIDKRSVWENKLNQSVVSEKLTIIDAPFVPEIGMYKTYDDDGMPTRTQDIIKNGVLKTFIHSNATAKILNTKSTGNASGQSTSFNCAYVEKGNTPKEEIIKSIKSGIYITDLKGFHSGLNASSGDFSLEISGNIITDGVIGKAIKTGILSGNVFKDILNNIEFISNDNDFRKHEWSPTVKLARKLSVTK